MVNTIDATTSTSISTTTTIITLFNPFDFVENTQHHATPVSQTCLIQANNPHPPTEHLPAIEAVPSLSLKAIYSRSESSAKELASATASSSENIDIYFDKSTSGSASASDKSLDALLARSDIDAVVIALPILAQPDVIKKALKAGKHVLSEKPVAKDVKDAKELVQFYGQLETKKPLWAVAENFRYTPSLMAAADKVKEVGGNLTTFRLNMNGWVEEENKYYKTECRFPLPFPPASPPSQDLLSPVWIGMK